MTVRRILPLLLALCSGTSCAPFPPAPSDTSAAIQHFADGNIEGSVQVSRQLAEPDIRVRIEIHGANFDRDPFTRPCFSLRFVLRCSGGSPFTPFPQAIPPPNSLTEPLFCPCYDTSLTWTPTFTDWRRVPPDERSATAATEMCSGLLEYRIELLPTEHTTYPSIEDSFPRAARPLTHWARLP